MRISSAQIISLKFCVFKKKQQVREDYRLFNILIDNKTFRLAFRFVQFLTKLASVDGETFQVNDSINDDVVSRLFEDETNHGIFYLIRIKFAIFRWRCKFR
jgi:hypothetical protein